MTITLMHGWAGLIAGFLAAIGVAEIGAAIWQSVASRVTVHVDLVRVACLLILPRRVSVHRRWDRPGARVAISGSRRARVMEVVFDSAAGGIAMVQPCSDDEEIWHQPEWVPLGDMTPAVRDTGARIPPAGQEGA